MDLSKLSMSELKAYQKKLEQYLKNNQYASTINKAAADAYTGTNPEYSMPQNTVAQKARAADRALATLGMANERSLMSEGAKDFLKSYEVAKQTFPEQEAFKKYAKESLKNTYAPMETPYGKSFLSYTPEGKIAGKAGSMLRGLGRVAGPLGAALTALDLAQGLGEVQDKGAAKIAEDYKKSKMAESEAEILTPEADQFKESLKSRRTELEILRAELERKRKEEEKYKQEDDQRIARQARVRDTLEQTGLVP
jgi:lipoate-protein ligase A